MKRLQFCLAVFAVLFLALSAFAQVQNGQFEGTVTDPTGAAIANAKVTVTNAATGLSVAATTNASGGYTVKEVPPGIYKVAVEAPGFKKLENSGVTANAGTISRVDVKLQMGKASETVEVTGEAAAVNTEDSKLATTVSSTQINNLPLNGRSVFDLMQLSMSAQYGNSAGGTVNLVTKPGTNAWHGSGWEYIRNNWLDANDFFSNQSGDPRAGLHFNQFGVTVGGPIIKDKLFFFLALQGDRFNSI